MNATTEAGLWARLQAFEVDDARAQLRFSDRLAAENRWSAGYARRVIEEYKRFIFLCRVAGHRVAPSDPVDQAWHLHLCYTRSYWDGMCGEILGAPVHHGPTRGGAAEREKFAEWYGRTLDAYRAHFDSEPPADIWPPVAQRFAPRDFRRIDASEHFLIPRKRAWAAAAAGGLVAVLAGCGTQLLGADRHGFPIPLPALIAIGVVLALFLKMGRGGGGNLGGGGGGDDSSCGDDGCGDD